MFFLRGASPHQLLPQIPTNFHRCPSLDPNFGLDTSVKKKECPSVQTGLSPQAKANLRTFSDLRPTSAFPEWAGPRALGLRRDGAVRSAARCGARDAPWCGRRSPQGVGRRAAQWVVGPAIMARAVGQRPNRWDMTAPKKKKNTTHPKKKQVFRNGLLL